jgi:hypothetical protein
MSSVNEYYEKKAYKYFTKYTMLINIIKNRMLHGGGKPDWYETLVDEAKIIYSALSQYTNMSEEPKNIIILSGSAALALLLGEAGMDKELHDAFIDPANINRNLKPNDLDFIYQGVTKEDNFDIKNITVMNQGDNILYNRKEATAISSPKYIIEKNYMSSVLPTIKDFDLTNTSQNRKETSFTMLNYVNIRGIKVLSPESLLSFYKDDSLEKNTNKIKQLTNLILAKKYNTMMQSKKYIPVEQTKSRFYEMVSLRPKLRFDDDDIPSGKIPKLNLEDDVPSSTIPKLSFD